MRFLLVTQFFGGEQTPTGRMACDVALELRDLGHDVAVLASSGTYVGESPRPTAAELGVEVCRLRAWGRSRIVAWGSFWLQAMLRVPASRWDRCVLLTDPPFLLMAAWLERRRRGKSRRLYWWTMDLYPEALVAAGIVGESGHCASALRALNEMGLAALDGVVALGPRQIARLQTYRRWNSETAFSIVVPPWDLRPLRRVAPEFNRVAERFGWRGRRVALYAGNLGEGHLFKEFADAARFFHDGGRFDWLFVFAIRGSGRASLLDLTADLPNVQVMNYLPEADTAELLWSATVHLISMKPGWEGVIVPSKFYGPLQTASPILFIGPSDADTAVELGRLGCGLALPPGATGGEVALELDNLAQSSWLREPLLDTSGPRRVAEFLLR